MIYTSDMCNLYRARVTSGKWVIDTSTVACLIDRVTFSGIFWLHGACAVISRRNCIRHYQSCLVVTSTILVTVSTRPARG